MFIFLVLNTTHNSYVDNTDTCSRKEKELNMAKDDINKEGLRDKHEFTDKSGESQSTE